MNTQTLEKIEKGYRFDKENHVHLLDGRPLYGVTNVLSVIAKPALIQWAANEAVKYIRERVFDVDIDTLVNKVLEEAKTAHRKKKEKAGEQGVDTHSEVEAIIKGAIKNFGGYVQGYAENENKQIKHFVNWATNNKVKFLASEQNLWSEQMWVGGITDFVCEINGKKFVGDIKTSSAVYAEHFLQMAAYMLMLEELGKKDFAGSVVIRLGKDGSFEDKFSYDMETDKRGFLAALELFKVIESYKRNN